MRKTSWLLTSVTEELTLDVIVILYHCTDHCTGSHSSPSKKHAGNFSPRIFVLFDFNPAGTFKLFCWINSFSEIKNAQDFQETLPANQCPYRLSPFPMFLDVLAEWNAFFSFASSHRVSGGSTSRQVVSTYRFNFYFLSFLSCRADLPLSFRFPVACERRRISGCHLVPPKNNVYEPEPGNDFCDVMTFVSPWPIRFHDRMKLECSSQQIPRAVVLGLFELNCDWLIIPTSPKSFSGSGSQTLFFGETKWQPEIRLRSQARFPAITSAFDLHVPFYPHSNYSLSCFRVYLKWTSLGLILVILLS